MNNYLWLRDPADSRDAREEWVPKTNPYTPPPGYVHRPAIMRNHNCDGERACVEGSPSNCGWPQAMTTHIIRAQPRVTFRVPGLVDMESADPLIEIEFSYLAGYPATGPSYASGGEPGAGAELELVGAKLLDGDGLDPDQKQIEEWAADWLGDDGYDRACQLAEDEQGPDPDYERERRREDR